jgi:hypothetical protein
VGLEPTTYGLTVRRSAKLSYPGSGHRCYRTHSRVHVYDAPLVTTDPVRARWAAGETAFAAWLTLDNLRHLLAAIQPTQALPLVRAAWKHPADLMRALDLGARRRSRHTSRRVGCRL